ncbi:hypothetical protein OEA41_008646 [Lepraria neglecta]|uniref:Uncharacterized protein n=1 Tax=Lepraria neglecta TaxID=209136 RepID=A0AAD9Z2E5_9LECA|nr:hypothetical protein OEA41_008646 [Lepraria neglecta]
MANERPETQVVAADLTPPSIKVPSNLTIVESNAEEDWPFQQRFTFIHARMLTSAIHDWPALLQRCWDFLQPGGWLELLEVVSPYRSEIPTADNPSSPFIKWGYAADEGWASEGLDWTTTSKHVQRLTSLGFMNIHEAQMRWPLGEWADTEVEQRIGAMTLQNFAGFFSTTAQKIITKNPNLDKDEAEILTRNAYNDLVSNCATNRYFLMV